MGLVGGILGGAGGVLSSLLSSGSGYAGSGGPAVPQAGDAPANGAAGVPAGLPAAAPAPVAAAVGSPSEVSGSRSVPEPVRAAGGTGVDEGAVRVDFGAIPVRNQEDDGRAYAIAAQAAERQAALVERLGAQVEAPVAVSDRSEAPGAMVAGAGEMRGALDALRGRAPEGGVLDKVA